MPAFILTTDSCVSGLTDLLSQGIEDVLPIGRNLDLLMSKLHKIRARLPAAHPDGDAGSGGAHGRLSDMNLIDLLQALGPGLKTARLTVRSEDGAHTLVIWLSAGKITFAELDDLRGPEAIYQGLEWDSGTWTVEPVTPDDLPRPNVNDSNESILMEGCRRLDERLKSGHLL
jgi:hypothetical protein